MNFSARYFLAVTMLASSACFAEDRPNLLFVFADDQAFDTIHAQGNSEIQTPNLDRLFEQGTSFTQTYNQGGWNGAICIASRTMLNTGLYIWHAEAVQKDLKSKWVPEKKMWAQQLAAKGYQTFFSGKWHVKADASEVFEVARNIRGGMPNQTPAGYDRPTSPDDKEWQPWDKKYEGFWKGGTHWSEVLGNDAIDYLDIAAKDERPFFMYLAFNAPHDPRQSPKEFVDRYPLESVSLPQTFQANYPYEIGSNKCRDEKLAPFPRTPYAVKVNRQEYYAIITHMDQQIGRIIDHLEATGQRDNTYIIFTADHGLACGHHGLLGKQNMHDHSVRVPFCVVGPGIAAGRKIGRRIYMQSLVPTTFQLAGLDVPEHVEFEGLASILKSDTASSEVLGTAYSSYTTHQRMVTVGNDKLIVYPQIGVSLLYDLAADPLEQRELSSHVGSQALKKTLFAELLKQQQLVGDTLDLKSVFTDLAEAN